MQKLNLPIYHLKTREVNDKLEVFDIIRKKYVLLTPEEWVRQQFVNFLINEKNYPASLIAIEKGIKVLKMSKRFDAVVSDQKGYPVALIEFKSPEVNISQKVFEQIATYNMRLKVSHLIVSNGIKHYCCKVDYKKKKFTFLDDIPVYNDLTESD